MSHSAAHGGTLKGVVTAPRAALTNRIMLGVAVIAIMRAGAACAGDPAVAAMAQPQHDFAPRETFSATSGTALPEFTKHYTLSDPLLMAPHPLLTAPAEYKLLEIPEIKSYSATDFRPRGRSIFDSDPKLTVPVDALGSNKSKDLMQQLQQYRSRDHVRVLTLWENGASAVSIQTDRKGDPSLQWTSHLFNKGGATQGLLDRLFPVSAFGGTTHVTRSATSQPSRVSGALSALHFGSEPPP
jgi:hypothetical protein